MSSSTLSSHYHLRTITAIIIVIFLLLSSCSEDKPTEPEVENNNNLISIIIDENGGTLETEEFKLEIPPGAFNVGVELSLLPSSNNIIDDNAVTNTYKLKGLPNTFAKPLKIGIKYAGSLKNESFIRFEQKLLFQETGDTLSNYNIFEIKDSSGFMWAQIPLQSSGFLSKANSSNMFEPLDIFYFGGWSDFQTDISPHFKIQLSSDLSSYRSRLFNILEDNYSKIVDDVGLSFDGKWWEWPISVYGKENPFILDYFNYLSRILRTHKYFDNFGGQQFDVNGPFLIQDNFKQLTIESGKDLTNLALSIYFDKDKVGELIPQDSWVRRAIYTWAEELFTSDQNFVSPEKFKPNAMLSLEVGMAEIEWSKSLLNLAHGDGMSSVIKYLVDNKTIFGNEGLKKTLESIKTGTKPVTALINNVGALKSEWLLDYFKNYVGGNIYSVPANIFDNTINSFSTWNITNEADTLKEFEATVAGVGKLSDLSAKLFKVNLNFADIDPSKSLIVDVEGDVTSDGFSSIIFSYKNGYLEHLVQGYASDAILEIPNLKDSGYEQFLIVVVNSNGVPPYNGSSNAYLTFRVEGDDDGDDQILASNRCFVSIKVNGHLQRIDQNGVISESSRLLGVRSYQTVIGSFAGNSFSGNYYDDSDDIIGTVTIDLNGAHDLATNISLTIKTSTTASNGDFYEETSTFSAFNIPVGEPDRFGSEASNNFFVEGEETCTHFSSVEYFSKEVNDEVTLLNYSCSLSSEIKITFGQE